MKIFKQYIIVILFASITGAILSSTLKDFFMTKLHEESIDFRKDQYQIAKLNDLYLLACMDKAYQETQECKDLSQDIKATLYRINNDYKYISFYFKYIKESK